jgi:hypothetical protein
MGIISVLQNLRGKIIAKANQEMEATEKRAKRSGEFLDWALKPGFKQDAQSFSEAVDQAIIKSKQK